MSELLVCFGMWLGICGSIVTERFPNEAACTAALAEMKKAKAYTYGYCRQPKDSK